MAILERNSQIFLLVTGSDPLHLNDSVDRLETASGEWLIFSVSAKRDLLNRCQGENLVGRAEKQRTGNVGQRDACVLAYTHAHMQAYPHTRMWACLV